MRTFNTEVLRGIVLLDRYCERNGLGDWKHEVLLEFLDLRDPNRCVLAQLFDSFGYGLKELGLEGEEVAAHGFDIPIGYFDESDAKMYQALTAAWKAALSEWRMAA